jgi:hypothetical protein
MIQNVTIATSLAPGKGIDIQREAVHSWQRIGFTVISVNCEEEIAVLKPYFPTIEFIRVFKDARNQYGKPYIYFDDIMTSLWKQESKICGIVNSDIHLVKAELYSFLLKEAVDSFIYGSRIDVENLSSTEGEVVREGFDYFFFDKSVITAYPPSALCMGLPCWDYWAILVPLFSGIPVKKVMTSHAYHIKHTVNWNNEISNRLFRYLLLRHIRPLSIEAASPYYILALIDQYSRKLTFYNEDTDRDTRQKLLPYIKNVTIKGDIQGRIIDKLLFLKTT